MAVHAVTCMFCALTSDGSFGDRGPAICPTRQASFFMFCRHLNVLPSLVLLQHNGKRSVRHVWHQQQAPFAASQPSGSPDLIRHDSFPFRLRTIQTDVLLLVTELTIPAGHCSVFRTFFDCLTTVFILA